MCEQDAQPTGVTEPLLSTASYSSQPKAQKTQETNAIPPRQNVPPSDHASNRANASGSSELRPRTATQPSQHRLTVEEIERSLEVIAPFADADEGVREQVRELRVLLTRIRRRKTALLERGRRLHQLRLALERKISMDFKSRIKRPEDTSTHPDGPLPHDPASTSSKGSADGRGAHSETDEEGDILEVEEMTSREVDRSDLPSPSARSADHSTGDSLPKDNKRPGANLTHRHASVRARAPEGG
ncbi:hypothetical protein C8Q73DRAFT_707931 [Cubamyces lactineus]|nr:hypothetical protein C8Q73DRAFT_707931 [Cubamyces lactineus]